MLQAGVAINLRIVLDPPRQLCQPRFGGLSQVITVGLGECVSRSGGMIVEESVGEPFCEHGIANEVMVLAGQLLRHGGFQHERSGISKFAWPAPSLRGCEISRMRALKTGCDGI